jgi:hypothetical protein
MVHLLALRHRESPFLLGRHEVIVMSYFPPLTNPTARRRGSERTPDASFGEVGVSSVGG